MLVSRTGLTFGFACAYTHINVHTHISTSSTISSYTTQRKGVHTNVEVKQRLVSPLKAKGRHLGNARTKTARIVVVNGYRFVVNTSMNIAASVEVNVWAVFSLLVSILTVNSSKDNMACFFGELNAHVKDPTATFWIN